MKGQEPILRVDGLEVRYGEFGAVRGVDLELPAGRTLALVGPSGCGKTSLLRAIAGFEVPAKGTVRIAGRIVVGPGRWEPPERRRVGMVFQEGALFPHLTVEGNVRYGVGRGPAADERAQEVLELVGLGEVIGRMPDELSGGQQQRLALARALAPAPSLILLDEPFASLDASLRERVREQVREILARAGATALVVTHDQEEALSFADRVAVMFDGSILQVGTPEEIYHRPESLEVAGFIGVGRLVEARVKNGRFETALGCGRCDATDGEVLVLLRPEDLMLSSGDAGGGCRGIVEHRVFYGHDCLDRVKMASGDEFEVRVLSSEAVPVGSSVSLGLRDQEYTVFPRPG